MLMIIGMDISVFEREARKAVFLALATSSALASTMPRTFFWFGQMSTHTLNNMIVPNHAPTPIVIPYWFTGSVLRPSMNALPNCPLWKRKLAPVIQVANAPQRNQASARGATYLVIPAP